MKKKFNIGNLLALLAFLLPCTVYLLTLSNDFAGDTDNLLTAGIIENPSSCDPKGISHLLWIPLGRLAYRLFSLIPGLHLRGLTTLEIVSALSGAVTALLFFRLMAFVTGNLAVSSVTTLFMAFSYMQWLVCTTPKIYPLSGLFLVLSFHLLLKATGGDRKSVLALAGAQALAFVSHITNIFFMIPVICGFFLEKRAVADKFKTSLFYLAAFLIAATAAVSILIALNLKGIPADEILPNIVQQVKFSTGIIENARTMVDLPGNTERIAPGRYWSCFLSFIARDASLQVVLSIFILACMLLSIIFFRNFAGSSKCVSLSIIWGVATFLILINTVYGNLNIYTPIFPFWILTGLAFSVLARTMSISPYEILIRGLMTAVLSLLLGITFVTNLNGYFLPASLGVRDGYYMPVKYYADFLTSEDTVFCDRQSYPYFTYFTRSRVLGLDLDDQNFPALMELIKESLREGKRVLLHLNTNDGGYYSSDGGARARFITPSDLESIRRRLAGDFQLVPYRNYSSRDRLLMFRLTAHPR
jgi:hypothetical protein